MYPDIPWTNPEVPNYYLNETFYCSTTANQCYKFSLKHTKKSIGILRFIAIFSEDKQFSNFVWVQQYM